MKTETAIISITDIIEQKVKKEQELRNFEAQLKDLLQKKFWLEKEIQIHEFIIAAVRDEITPQAFIQGLIKAELSKDENLDLMNLIVWSDITKTGDISECNSFKKENSIRLWNLINYQSEFCTLSQCNFNGSCFYINLRKSIHMN